MAHDERVVVGQFGAPYGVQGWLRVNSFTEPMERILSYQPWQVVSRDRKWTPEVVAWRRHGKGLVVKIRGCDDREQTAVLLNADITIARSDLPVVKDGEYYWADLEGLLVVTVQGVVLGRVDHLFDTGANEVLVVKGDRLRMVPFDRDNVIRLVDLAAKRLVVDWDPDF